MGTHDRVTQEPLPDHIDARHEDLRSLINGIVSFDELSGRGALDPVVAATSVGFGFVYVHRYFDATAHAEFLYHCVRTTIESDLPYEVAYLQAYDAFTTAIASIVDMPARTQELLHRFLRQNNGRLSKRSRSGEFASLNDDEVATIERYYAESVVNLPAAPATTESAGYSRK